MQNPPFVPLSRKRFTSKDFKKRLDENLEPLERESTSEEIDAANEEIRNAETRIDESKKTIAEADFSELDKANESVDTRSKFGKAIDWATTPLSGDFFQRTGKRVAEFMDDPNKEGYFKTTGKGDLQDWLGWGEATLRGAHRGAIEGTGAAIDSFTSPADLAATATGFGALGAATRGFKTAAQGLRRGTQLASMPIAYQGGKGMYEAGSDIVDKGFEGFDPEDLKRFSLSGVQAVAGIAGTRFPKSVLESRYPKPPVSPDTPAPSVGAEQGMKFPPIKKPSDTTPYVAPETIADPNLNQGVGDPMAAGSAPMKRTSGTEVVKPEVDLAAQEARLNELHEKVDANTATQAELHEAADLIDQRYDREQAASAPAKTPVEEAAAAGTPIDKNFLTGLKFPEKPGKETVNTETGELATLPASKRVSGFRVKPQNMSGPQLAAKVMDTMSARPEIPPVDSISSQRQEIDANGLEMERLHQESEQMRSGPEYTATGAKIRELALRNKALWAEIDATSNVPAVPPVDELAALKTRKDVLAAKHNRTGRFEGGESAEFMSLGQRIKNFMSEDKGELNVDAFLGEYQPTVGRSPVDIQSQPDAREFAQMGDELLTNTSRIPTGSRVDSQIPKPRVPTTDQPARSFPSNKQPTAEFAYENKPGWGDENEVPLKLYRVNGGPLDGSDVSAQTLLDNGIAVPDQAAPVPQHKMPNEFMPDMRQVDEFMPDLGPDARTSRYEQQVPGDAYVPPAKASMGDKIRNFMREDSGELDTDFMSRFRKQKEEPLVGKVRARLRELYDKDQTGKLTAEDLVEGQRLTKHLNDPSARRNKHEDLFPEEAAAYRRSADDQATQLRKEGYNVDMEGNPTKPSQAETQADADLEKMVGGKANMDKIKLDDIIGWLQKFRKGESGELDVDAIIGKPKVTRKDPTSAHYQSIIDRLDAEGAPDTAYRDSLSTGGRTALKKGETWRDKLNTLANYLDRNNPDSPYNRGDVPDSITTQAAVPEPAPTTIPEAPLAAQVDLSKLKFKGGERKPKVEKEAPGDSTLAYGQPGSSKRSAIPARKPGESPIAAAKRVAQEEIPETVKNHPVGSAAESPIAEALFGRGDLDSWLKTYLNMARRNAKDSEFQTLIPEALRKSTDADGNPSFELAAGESWRKKASALHKAAQENAHSKKIPMSGGEDWDPKAFSAARNEPEVIEAIQTMRDLEKRIPDTKDPDVKTRLKGDIERQHTVISRALNKIKNFMGEESGEFDADFGRETGLTIKDKVHIPEVLEPSPYDYGDTNNPDFGKMKRVEHTRDADSKWRAKMKENWGDLSKEEINKYIELQSAMNGSLDKITPKMHDEFVALDSRRPGKSQPDQYLMKQQAEQTRLKNVESSRTLEGAPSNRKRLSEHVKNFMSDEEGSINMDKILGKPKPKQTEYPKSKQGLLSFDQLKEGPTITARKEHKVPEQSMLGKAKDLPKGLMSVDLPYITSAAFRQTKPLAWTTEWFKAWGQSAKAYGDEAASKAIFKSIMDSKNFKPQYKPKINSKGETIGYKEMPSRAETVGVHLSGSKLLPGEEQIRAQWAEKLPWVKASNRAYSTFINHMRQTKLDEMLDLLDAQGNGNNLEIGKQIGDFVNTATGRGSLKWEGPGGRKLDLERTAKVLQNTMWAPRLLAANTKFLNPWTYINADPMVRGQYAAGAARMAATWIGFAGLAKAAGADVSLDPTSSDFGKIKIGDTRIDPAGGMQQLLVYLARQAPGELIGNSKGELLGFPTGSFSSSATGKRKEFGTGAFPIDRASVTEDFLTSKLDPVTRLAYELMRSSSQRPVHIGDKAVQMVLPIMAQDIMDAMKEDPSLERLLGSSLGSSAGLGVNTYGKGEKFSDPVFTDSIEEALGMSKRSLAGSIGKW